MSCISYPISANPGYFSGSAGTLSASNVGTDAGTVYVTPNTVYPQLHHLNGNLGHNLNANSYEYPIMGNGYQYTNSGIIHSQMFNVNGNHLHNLTANLSAYQGMSNGYLGTNAGHGWVVPQSQMFYATANPAHNRIPNLSAQSVINNGFSTANAGDDYVVLNAKHCTSPEKEIVLMQVWEIACWIYNLGTSLNWDMVDCNNIRSKLIENNINGKKLLEMEQDDLWRTCNIKKLGHRLTIIKVLEAHRCRTIRGSTSETRSSSDEAMCLPPVSIETMSTSSSSNLQNLIDDIISSAKGKHGAYSNVGRAKATGLRHSCLKLTLQLDDQDNMDELGDLLKDLVSKFEICEIKIKPIDKSSGVFVFIVKFKSIMMAQEALLASEFGYKTNTPFIKGGRLRLEKIKLDSPKPKKVCKFKVLAEKLPVSKERLYTDLVEIKNQNDVIYIDKFKKPRRARLVENGKIVGWVTWITEEGIPQMEQLVELSNM